jgi:hypothetical protein
MIIFSKLKTKTFILKTITNGREVYSTMNCEYCGKPVKEYEEFILVGKYPTRGQMWKWSEATYYVAPESYGKIYHKDCFITAVKKEETKP